MNIIPFKPLKLKPNTKEYSNAPIRIAFQTKASQDKTAEGCHRIRADRPDRNPTDILSEGHAAKTNRVGREKRKGQKAERNLKRTLFAQAKFTKAVFDDLFHGIKKPQGIRPANLKKNIQAAYQGKTIRLNKLRIKDIVAHMKGEKTLYFSAPWRIKAEYLLALIDIDIQKSQQLGTTEGAWEYAKRLDALFPGCIFEPSTNGKGVHGYIVLKRDSLGNNLIAELYGRLEKYLRHLALEWNADIETVEIKGRPARWDWTTTTILKSGTLAKLPRSDISDTFACSATDLLKLPTEYAVPKGKERKAQSLNVGSICPLPDALEDLPTFQKLGTSLHAEYNWQPTGRRKVIAEDVQVFAYLIHHCTLDMNDDGSMPTERINALWTWLYEAGITSRPYDPHRYKAIRDGFSDMGLLEWADHHYVIGLNGDGQACKWAGSDAFMDMVEGRENENRKTEEHLYCNTDSILRFFVRPVCVEVRSMPWKEPKTG